MCREIQLPNISGKFYDTGNNRWTAEDQHSGAFYEHVASGDEFGGFLHVKYPAGGKGYSQHRMDANRQSYVYKGTNFQPKAGLTLLCIKV